MIRARVSVAGCVGLLLCTLGAPAVAQQAGTRITERDLPHAVREAFRDAYPEARITGVTRDTRDGKFLYHVQSTEGQTRRDLVYSADGNLLESQESLPPEEIPTAIRETMSANFGSSRIFTHSGWEPNAAHAFSRAAPSANTSM